MKVKGLVLAAVLLCCAVCQVAASPETQEDADAQAAEISREEALLARARAVVRRQREIEIPHGLEHSAFEAATVLRVEPDGVHVRHAGGLAKIEMEHLSAEQRDRYAMDAEVAEWYRAVMARRRAAAAAVAAEAAAEAASEERVQHGERLAAIERNRNLWIAYDDAVRLYRSGRYDWRCPVHSNGIRYRMCRQTCRPSD